MKLCDTCIYRNNVEQLKPCIIYRDDCEYYEKERNMTREEAISIMNVIVHMLEPQYDTDRIEDAVDMSIKALENIVALGEDIKTEISKLQTYKCFEDTEKLVSLDEVLQIIDKYRGENKDAGSN